MIVRRGLLKLRPKTVESIELKSLAAIMAQNVGDLLLPCLVPKSICSNVEVYAADVLYTVLILCFKPARLS